MKNIVITGATSFIGVHIVKEYLKNNWNVLAVVRPNSKKINRLPKNDYITIIEMGMEEVEKLKDKFKNIKIDVFYHLAWEGARMPYRDDDILQNENYMYTIKAMKVAKELGCNIFIGAGSQAEYGICVGEIDESCEPRPTTEYGKAKLRAYETLKIMAKENDMKFIWTRIFSVYGVYDYQGTLVMSALDKMKRNESIPLTQCMQSWDFIYVEDVARAMYSLANTPCMDGIYNIASGTSRQLKDFIIDMKDICKSTSKLQFGAIPYNSEGVISFEPNIDKLKKNLGWSCSVEFDEGIKKILKFIN
ncbi:NAD(P)-dependent oxidoreductase [Clostridium estertheticum]|uniref:NAD-dependent epimerase/dehydratase family protein n=1 Tax=Clostridium estertheticum TaxID=238834 RepID=UPI001C7DB986|nr:NAD(P)-dependent oxidoreductase [Clostridium estertheticum]MBX4260780.1 NAD(P)-dependent oxidoreductase [Clostridium estertheticum]WLC70353.1 NAD(P)-dependent oxidoreductase [Clostridium estertheticum]